MNEELRKTIGNRPMSDAKAAQTNRLLMRNIALERSNVHELRQPLNWSNDQFDILANREKETDQVFIKSVLVPYLSNLFMALISQQAGNKDYLTLEFTRNYLNCPEVLGSRLLQ